MKRRVKLDGFLLRFSVMISHCIVPLESFVNYRCILYGFTISQINKRLTPHQDDGADLHFISVIDHCRSLCILIVHWYTKLNTWLFPLERNAKTEIRNSTWKKEAATTTTTTAAAAPTTSKQERINRCVFLCCDAVFVFMLLVLGRLWFCSLCSIC